MNTTNHTTPAVLKPPYYLSESQCEGVYGGQNHYAIFADECRGTVADLEGGMTPETKATGEFIVRACNIHQRLLNELDHLLKQTVDMDLAHGIELTEGEKEAREQALAIFAELDE